MNIPPFVDGSTLGGHFVGNTLIPDPLRPTQVPPTPTSNELAFCYVPNGGAAGDSTSFPAVNCPALCSDSRIFDLLALLIQSSTVLRNLPMKGNDFEALTEAMSTETKQLNVKNVVITAGPAWSLRAGDLRTSSAQVPSSRLSESSNNSFSSSRNISNASFAICVDGELFGPFAKIAVGPCEATKGVGSAQETDSDSGDTPTGAGVTAVKIPVMSFLPPTSTTDESNAPLV